MNYNLDILRGKQILIIEDEEFIGGKIKKLLERYTENTILLSNCIERTLELIKEYEFFDMLLVDVMIPETKFDVKMVREYEERLNNLRKDFELLNSSESSDSVQNQIHKKRIERSEVLKGIADLIDEDGGIRLIETIKIEYKNKMPKSVIFLTAVGDESKIRRGIEAAGVNSRWLIKPIPNSILIETCCEIISQQYT